MEPPFQPYVLFHTLEIDARVLRKRNRSDLGRMVRQNPSGGCRNLPGRNESADQRGLSFLRKRASPPPQRWTLHLGLRTVHSRERRNRKGNPNRRLVNGHYRSQRERKPSAANL